MRRTLLGLLVLAVTVLAPASPAWAHNRLTAATPAADARLATAPAGVTLEFAEALNATYTQIVVTDAAKARVPVSAPAVDGATGVVTFDGTLPDGVYTVAYRVVSKDGHPVQGSYAFTVGDPPPVAVAVAAPPPAPEGGVPAWVWWVAAAGVLVAAAAWAGRKVFRRGV